MSGIEPDLIRYSYPNKDEVTITETYVLKDKSTRQYVTTVDAKSSFLQLENATAKSELVGLADPIETKSEPKPSGETTPKG